MKCSICKQEGHNKRSCKENAKDELNTQSIKATQRKTTNLGFNTSASRDESYAKIEAKSPTAKCSDSKHEGDKVLPIRRFYLNKGGDGLQGACIVCQKRRRADRIKNCRNTFKGKTKEEICDMYNKKYGETKTCSKCKISKLPSEFIISVSIETGLHNHCTLCSIGNSQGNGGLRDFIFFPDKDGIKYKKKKQCERCGGTDKLAVDHILPIAKGGNDCIINKQTLCIHCNSRKSDTIDCIVKMDFLCVRYNDISLDFTDNESLSFALSKKVYDFRKDCDSSLDEIRLRVDSYIKKHNLGHSLDRIVAKLSVAFNKT